MGSNGCENTQNSLTKVSRWGLRDKYTHLLELKVSIEVKTKVPTWLDLNCFKSTLKSIKQSHCNGFQNFKTHIVHTKMPAKTVKQFLPCLQNLFCNSNYFRIFWCPSYLSWISYLLSCLQSPYVHSLIEQRKKQFVFIDCSYYLSHLLQIDLFFTVNWLFLTKKS